MILDLIKLIKDGLKTTKRCGAYLKMFMSYSHIFVEKRNLTKNEQKIRDECFYMKCPLKNRQSY